MEQSFQDILTHLAYTANAKNVSQFWNSEENAN